MTEADDLAKLPEALRALLVRVRAGLREKGDDGSAGAPRSAVSVKMGWPEVRAVYALYTALGVARSARDTWQKRATSANRVLEHTRAASRNDTRDNDLLNDHAVLALLATVEQILSGAETSETALHATRNHIRRLLGRR